MDMLDFFVPFLEAHSELTIEEQRIFDDFKAQHPIRTYDDVEKAQGTFKIYQLPSGEKYHGVRFESMDRLKADGVQLNKDDYELMYEGEVGEFRGNATLEALFAQFNNDRPDDFFGHSLSVSDVIVISIDGNAACEFRFDKGTAQHKRFTAFIELRDLTRELIEAMELDKPDSVIKDLQAKLNVAYDDFYKKFGLIHSQTNKRYFAEDVSYNLVAGLEKSYDMSCCRLRHISEVTVRLHVGTSLLSSAWNTPFTLTLSM